MPLTFNRAIMCFHSDLSCTQNTAHGKEGANTQLQSAYSQQRVILTSDILSKNKKLKQSPWYTESTWCASFHLLQANYCESVLHGIQRCSLQKWKSQ